ncbi:MAG: hypothetical protein HWQ23_15260 [Nostoc sp. JL33]|uniref:hypothetical protein n=1 Tax=Nostoc sp. JL33 TaxID=2815396 RepID=UPI0025D6A18D|nr:hypothetical protein [Nostoc sp. JL33]MBN3871580.1 hypothetical protein [Nostoc sp. JL33]
MSPSYTYSCSGTTKSISTNFFTESLISIPQNCFFYNHNPYLSIFIADKGCIKYLSQALANVQEDCDRNMTRPKWNVQGNFPDSQIGNPSKSQVCAELSESFSF